MEDLHILIPTDFSVQAEFAFLMVKKLAEKLKVSIHFVHVLAVPDTVFLDSYGKIQTCGEIDKGYIEKQMEIAQRKLDTLRTLYGNDIETSLLVGKVTTSIISFAENNHFDLIVTGTKGKWGLSEKLAASETQMIARKSSIPVLSLMCDRSDLIIENILLVHNFSSPVKENLSLIHKIIIQFGAKVHFLQMVSPKEIGTASDVENNMKTWAALNGIEQFTSHVLSDTDVEAAVTHFNQMHNMDIICIGTHAKPGIFHSSATERLINHLYKPIITFHLN